ncbi:MAG: YciI family protein [Stellaceae bacterium]
MRFMVLLKADKSTEAGVPPSTELIAAMGKYNEELVKAGVMLAGEGLQPSSKGARIKFSGEKRTVTKGPFPERELIAGFWMFQVNSIEEAIEWVKRCPDPLPGSEAEIEIRQVFEASDFETMTPELKEQEERLRATVEARRRSP